MIVTCTLNPSLDCYMESSRKLERGEENRSELEYYEAGGKGINVSIVLNNLEVPTKACGFLGGFTKDFYITLLEKYSFIQPNFTYIAGHTRINMKFHDADVDTQFNAAGPYITHEDMEKLMMKTNRLDEGDYFVLAGNCPEHLYDDTAIMLERLVNDGVRVCLNTDTALVKRVLPFHPYIVKTTVPLLEGYLGHAADSEHIVKDLEEMKALGPENVICTSKDGKEAFLACDEGIFLCDIVHQDKAVSMIGTGDALVAGFIMNSMRTPHAVESFRFGCCCSEATAFSKGFGTRDAINELYERVEVTKIG